MTNHNPDGKGKRMTQLQVIGSVTVNILADVDDSGENPQIDLTGTPKLHVEIDLPLPGLSDSKAVTIAAGLLHRASEQLNEHNN